MTRDPGRAALLVVLAFAIYGRHLFDGPLADDFLYLAWLDQGPAELLRRLTIASNPQMIRPLPALGWLLSLLPAGFVLQHALGLALHGVCGALVARLVERGGGAPSASLGCGALFVAFPLFGEPVLWLSAAPDLWATALALGALERFLAARPLWGAGLFAAALLCKESVLMLPALLPFFSATRNWRPLALAGGVATLYLGWRVWLFSGVGGYLDAGGRSLALAVDGPRFLRNALLQWPFRVLQPLKGGFETPPGIVAALVAVTLILAAALLGTAGLTRRQDLGRALAHGGRAVAVLLLALLPAAAVFSVDVDHENARLLYFPLAAALAVGGPAIVAPQRGFEVAVALLAVFWGGAAMYNARPWSDASREVRATLATLATIETRFPAASTVFVAGNDVHRGAYAWRNGLGHAAARAGLRRDLAWRLGTAALSEHPEQLGRRVFEISVPERGRWIDWTPCARALADPDATWPAAMPGAAAVGAEILLPEAAPEQLTGRLAWRRPDARFTLGAARRFAVLPGTRRSVVRLPPGIAAPELDLRASLDGTGTLSATARAIALPPICRPQS